MGGRYFDVSHLAAHGHSNDCLSVAAVGHHGAHCVDAEPMATSCFEQALWVSYTPEHGLRRGMEPRPRQVFCLDERLDVVDDGLDTPDLVALGGRPRSAHHARAVDRWGLFSPVFCGA